MTYPTARFLPATPIGARTSAASDLGALTSAGASPVIATPFTTSAALSLESLALNAMGHSQLVGRAVVAIFAAGATGLPSGAALVSGAVPLRAPGMKRFMLPSAVALPAGNYYAIVGGIVGQPILAGIEAGLATALAVGAADISAPPASLYLATPIDPTTVTLTGGEPWSDWIKPSPLVWLGL